MVYNSLHCGLIEKRFDDALVILRSDFNGLKVKEMHNRDLPLHMALLVGAPDKLVIAIYNAYPQAANVKSRDKKTALEIAKEKRRSIEVKDVLSGKGGDGPRSNARSLRSSMKLIRSSLTLMLQTTMRNQSANGGK